MKLVEAVLKIVNCWNLDVFVSCIDPLNEIDCLLCVFVQPPFNIDKCIICQIDLFLNCYKYISTYD
jgi:hypothetical protein